MKEKKILEVAKYIIVHKSTIEETANHFEMSTSSIKKYINNKENLQAIDIELYEAVKKTQEEVSKLKNALGGKNGIRQPSHSDFEALEIAETMISNSMSLKEASKYFNVPTSTLYEMIKRIDNEEIQEELENLFAENNERFGKTNNTK